MCFAFFYGVASHLPARSIQLHSRQAWVVPRLAVQDIRDKSALKTVFIHCLNHPWHIASDTVSQSYLNPFRWREETNRNAAFFQFGTRPSIVVSNLPPEPRACHPRLDLSSPDPREAPRRSGKTQTAMTSLTSCRCTNQLLDSTKLNKMNPQERSLHR